MFDDNTQVLDRSEQARDDIETPRSAPISHDRDVESDRQDVTAPAPSPHERQTAKAPASPAQTDTAPPEATGQARKASFLRRRPAISAIGAVLLAAIVGGGVLYVNQAEHFQSTDDAFIATRQTSLAPKVSGYLTAVPVTDNQHVATGDVIARIDDRDYRVALQQSDWASGTRPTPPRRRCGNARPADRGRARNPRRQRRCARGRCRAG